MIRVTVETGRLPQQLQRAQAAIRTRWWQEFAPTAQSLIEREQRRHFSEQRGPDGTAWKPLSPLTLEISRQIARQKVASGQQRSAVVRRTGASRILTSSRTLERSVTTGGDGAIRQKGPRSLVVGTRLPYAARHQFGGTFPVTPRQRGYLSGILGRWFAGKSITTPARPFLGMGPQGKDDLRRGARATMNRVLRNAVKG